MKLVSIIVPVYNSEKSLKKCVESLLNQTYHNVEILLIDDGSKDSSGSLCDNIASCEEKVRVIHKANGGVSSARNAGVEAAQGEYVQFVDSDDWIEPDFTQCLVEKIEEYNAELVISGFTFIEKDGVSIKRLESKVYESVKEWSEDFGTLYQNYFLNSPCNKLFLSKNIKHKFPENISLGEDCIFVMGYLKQITRIVLTDAVGYCYDMRTEGSLTKQFNENDLQTAILMYQKVKEYSTERFGNFCDENKVKYVFLQDLRRYMFQIYMRDDCSIEEKMQSMKNLSGNEVLKECLTGAAECSMNQKILFWFLGHGYIRLMFLYLKAGWRK